MALVGPDFDHCADLVRRGDRDHFLCDLFAPADSRGGLFALHAFNLEIRRIPFLVREPMAGQVRLQWWQDVLEDRAWGDAQGNPIAAALLSTVDSCGLDRAQLSRLVGAREVDLHRTPMAHLADLEDYLEQTSSVLFAIGVGILKTEASQLGPAVRAAGMATGIVDLLRVFADHAVRGHVVIPSEILHAHGADPADINVRRLSPSWKAVVTDMVARARQQLEEASLALSHAPMSAVPIFLPLALVPAFLNDVERCGDDMTRVAELTPWRRQWILWRAARDPRRLGFE